MSILVLLLVLNVQDYIKSNEGFRSKPYMDEGLLAIGYGRNLQTNGISEKTANQMLKEDVNECITNLVKYYPWYLKRKYNAQIVLIDMCYQMGFPRLSKFENMLGALHDENYILAAVELLDSHYGRKFTNRANRNANLLRGK